MTYPTKLRKAVTHRGPSQALRHGIRYLLQVPAHPLISQVFSAPRHEQFLAAPVLGYWPRVSNPRSFNEKIIARKLSNERTELYSRVSDKYAVREFVRERVGDDVLADLYHVGNDPNSIPFEEFPEGFVVKATHGSGWTRVVEAKAESDLNALRKDCQEWLQTRYGSRSREYWYEDIDPQILVEELLWDPQFGIPRDFKCYVFHGEVQFIHVDFNRFSPNRSRRFFDRSWDPYEFRLEYPLGPKIEKPDRLEDMISIAEELGEGFDFVRVDLYHTTDNEIYFGEMTIAPGAGTETFHPTEWDFELGSHW